jgi:hypothetical protein
LCICTLFFADDIFLVAENRQDLQSLVWALEDWFFKHRLTINHTKSGVMRIQYGEEPLDKTPIEFGTLIIPDVESYKYCGVWFTSDSSPMRMQAEVLTKVNARIDRELRYTANNTQSHETRLLVWDQMIRCLFEYCFCIWGEDEWKEGEQALYRAAKIILGLPESGKVNIVAALGEMGWWTLQGRLHLLRLSFFNKLLSTPPDRLIFRVFLHSQQVYTQNLARPQPAPNRSFYAKLVSTLIKLGTPQLKDLISSPFDTRLQESKRDRTDIVRTYEQQRWWDQVQASPKLDTYKVFKTSLEPEPYLQHNPLLTQNLTRLRVSQHYLFVETGRWHRPHVPRAARLCILCSSGKVEDELHFLRVCRAYTDIRITCFNKILTISEGAFNLWHMSDLDFLRFVLSGSYTSVCSVNFTLCIVILYFIQKLGNHRRRLFAVRNLDPKKFHHPNNFS